MTQPPTTSSAPVAATQVRSPEQIAALDAAWSRAFQCVHGHCDHPDDNECAASWGVPLDPHVADRLAWFAAHIPVPDAGQYRNDWPAAIARLIQERDTAFASAVGFPPSFEAAVREAVEGRIPEPYGTRTAYVLATINAAVQSTQRPREAAAWDRLCTWLDAHVDTDVRGSVKTAARLSNPFRDED